MGYRLVDKTREFDIHGLTLIVTPVSCFGSVIPEGHVLYRCFESSSGKSIGIIEPVQKGEDEVTVRQRVAQQGYLELTAGISW